MTMDVELAVTFGLDVAVGDMVPVRRRSRAEPKRSLLPVRLSRRMGVDYNQDRSESSSRRGWSAATRASHVVRTHGFWSFLCCSRFRRMQ